MTDHFHCLDHVTVEPDNLQTTCLSYVGHVIMKSNEPNHVHCQSGSRYNEI